MKSKAQKRQEARERIEKSLPGLRAEIALIKSTMQGFPAKAEECSLEQLQVVNTLYDREEKLSYRLKEIQHIMAREAGPKRKESVIDLLA